jgi:hypothetical protein
VFLVGGEGDPRTAAMDTKEDVRTRLERLHGFLEGERRALASLRDDDLLDVVVELDECALAVRRALGAVESPARRNEAA